MDSTNMHLLKLQNNLKFIHMPIGIYSDTRNTYLNVTYTEIASCINDIIRNLDTSSETFHLVFNAAKEDLIKMNIEPTETKITDKMFDIFEILVKNSRIS